MFEHHFIRRIRRRLPYKQREALDYDYVMELSPDWYWHYHGLLALPASSAGYVWKNKSLHRRLAGDIKSFRSVGSQRPFRINSFLIEPVKSVDAWCEYITKQYRYDAGYIQS
jgi:hypothetical protein